MLSITLRQLEYALAVADHGGVKLAAEALHVSQPALSVAIAGLEDRLGYPLFIRRKGRAVVPTSRGRSFLAEAGRVVADAGRLVAPGGVAEGPLAVGCFEDLAPVVLAPVLAGLARALPKMAVTPLVAGFEELAREMREGRLDFAITYDLGLDAGFERREIARLEPYALVGSAHPLAARDAVSLAQLTAGPLVLTDQGLSIGHMLDLFRHRGLAVRELRRAATLETMRSLVANGFGAGLTYTPVRSAVSYDGKPVLARRLTDRMHAEPVVLATQGANPPGPSAGAAMDAVAAMTGLI